MKRYKLKKDLPTFKAGDEFYLSEKGNLVSADEQPVVAYSKLTLEKFPNILKDWFEEILEYKRWRAELGESYWFSDTNGRACEGIDDRYSIDDYRYNTGNYSKTKEGVKKYIDYLIALQTIKDDAKGFVPDWKDLNQPKYYGCYDYISECFDVRRDDRAHTQGVVYFKTKEDIEESFEKHRKEWLTVLGVKE